MTKDAVRAELRLRRRSFVASLDEGRAAAERELVDRLLPLVTNVGPVAFYRAVSAEVAIDSAVAAVAARGEVTALPRIANDRTMSFCRWVPGDRLVPGRFGCEQPDVDAAEIVPAAVVAPLVGFTRGGARLGQGGGFYDRAFAACPSARRIGVAWSVQEVSALPLDPWDVPLHLIVTECELIEIPL